MPGRKSRNTILIQHPDGVPETSDVGAASADLPDPNGTGNEMDSRELVLFRSLDMDNDQRVLLSDLTRALAEVGLPADDRRLTESMAALKAYLEEIEEHPEEKLEPGIPQGRFARAIRNNILLIERALQGSMVIPDFADFCDDIRRIYEATLANRSGKAANYIPQLDLPEPEVDQYGVAVCTIDGQRSQFVGGFEGAVFVHRLTPRYIGCPGDVSPPVGRPLAVGWPEPIARRCIQRGRAHPPATHCPH